MHILLLLASASAFVYVTDNTAWEIINMQYQQRATTGFTALPATISWTVVAHTGLAAFRVSIIHNGTMVCNNQTLDEPFPAPLSRLTCTVDATVLPFSCGVPVVMPWQQIHGNVARIRPPIDILPLVGGLVGAYLGTVLLFTAWIKL